MATILPTGETQFLDANGDPLTAGTVTFYIPGTTTPKDTWQNSGQSILNPNPVTLDAAGRAIIYGSGAYRQVVKDQFGNLIWDQETSEPNAGSVSFGGTSGGTANAQTLSAAQFSFGDGQIISFVAGISNTGAMTISIGGGSPITVLKNGVSGPVPLASGDIVAGNSYFIQYSASLAAFQLLLSVAPATPSGDFLKGYLYGLTLSNNGVDTVNDIDIATGSAASDGVTAVLMTLSSALTKRLDANWAVGSGNGWLDTGVVGNGTYHVFLIQRSDTGVVDSLASLSPSSPTMPANYDRKRRIGMVIRISGTIIQFTQVGTQYIVNATSEQVVSSSSAKALRTLNRVPTGISVRASLSIGLQIGVSSSVTHSIYTPLKDTSWPPDLVASVATTSAGFNIGNWYGSVETNTSGQVYSAVAISGACISSLVCSGWDDYTLRG